MTRETKIGLLVGLAFIIVIGILLSDHLTSATEPQQAHLAQVAGNVRTGVNVPGGNTANLPITTVAPQQPITPQQQVPTRQDLKPPVEIVQIGGTQTPQQSQPPITVAPEQTTGQTTGQIAGTTPPAAPQEHPALPGATPPANGSLASVAQSMGEEVVTLDGRKVELPQPPSRLTIAPPLPAGAKQYKAETGDSVSRIALKQMGGDTKANRAALIAANPSLQQNANMVILGRTYVIPATAGTSVFIGATPAPAPIASNAITTPPPAPAVTGDAPIAAPTPQYFYTVKAGDSLTRIAVEQLGSASGVPAIMDLNKDLLKGRDIIRPNMKLRLPAKPLASAQ
ncbi:MAG: LysM peptidoglycan-binding domain-containing protein [Tepidisphaeraceae bacterium]